MMVSSTIPGEHTIAVCTPSNRTRSGVNPFTGEVVALPVKDRVILDKSFDIVGAVENRPDYEVQVSGEGRPSLPLLPLQFEGPYCVTFRCRVSSVARSTSCINEWIDKDVDVAVAPYGEPCSSNCSMGFFTNPNNGPVIQLPDAGCARFWIEIELGKNLFPEFKNHDLNILNPEIVATVERVFAMPFVQGYHWG